ncbi:MAG: ankyrin repeat domain-containing protein [Sulfuricella sp.]|nr:ankyrin repeat domain-containing protein [Sulfuricella sp.]
MHRITLALVLAAILSTVSGVAAAGSIFDAALIGNAQEVAKFIAADPKLVHAKNELSSTPLHVAATTSSTEMAKMLISKGANLNARDNNGSTPLHLAAYTGRKEIAELLLSSGAIADAKDNNGATPLDYADKVPSNEVKPVLVLWLLKHPAAKPVKKN